MNSIIKRIIEVLPASKRAINSRFDKVYQSIQDETKGNAMLINRGLSKLDKIEFSTNRKIVSWHNAQERQIISANFEAISKEEDFLAKYLALVHDLDDDSVDTINKIINRVRILKNDSREHINLFSQSEQEMIFDLKENYWKSIVQITADVWAYKKYLLPIKHFEPSVFYYKHGIDHLKNTDRLKDTSIIDVGGFIGDSVLILDELPHKDIHTFEADPNNFKFLEKTIQLNDIKNVRAVKSALGSYCGVITLHTCQSGSTTIDRPGKEYGDDIEVPMITLDEYVKTNNLIVGLIKVDIEGGEPNFLKGAKDTICRQKPIILLSIYHNANDFFSLKPMIEDWGLDYKFRIYKPVDGNACFETLLICE